MSTEYYIITSYNKFIKINKDEPYYSGDKDMFNIFEAKNFPKQHYGHYAWSVTLPTDNFCFKKKVSSFSGIVEKVNMVIPHDIYYLSDPETFVMLQSKGLDLGSKTPEEWCEVHKNRIPSFL
ncbi:repeat protein [Moumouvirus goulette]|uniref:Repeat protein n=1 Tax=Moumouvirus goulette TaxID=1247379 RepID=M1PLZ2_9VIRU|nr:repeat protein [Moumouvirus goulette]AGF84916.1 repeat protein [Moumouvirus goulette]